VVQQRVGRPRAGELVDQVLELEVGSDVVLSIAGELVDDQVLEELAIAGELDPDPDDEDLDEDELEDEDELFLASIPGDVVDLVDAAGEKGRSHG
jgi:hypothetical protein